MKIEFIKSALKPEDFPECLKPEVALVGRSNSGKSSLINAWAGRREAKVSNTPGKTNLVNFFEAGQHYRIVDLPGYGFAKVSNKEATTWKRAIEGYITGRECLVGLILLCDSRRDWDEEERTLIKWADKTLGLPVVLGLTKVDKLNRSEMAERKKAFEKVKGPQAIHMISALSGQGLNEIEDWIFKNWIKTALDKLKAGDPS